MRFLKGVPFTHLVGETIIKQKYGSDLTIACGSYGAITYYTKSKREFVIWTGYGEVNLSEVFTK